MPEWVKGAGFYVVQPSNPQMTSEECKAYLDNLLAQLNAKLEEAKLKRKGVTQ